MKLDIVAPRKLPYRPVKVAHKVQYLYEPLCLVFFNSQSVHAFLEYLPVNITDILHEK